MAAITIVSYSGISKKAIAAGLQNDLDSSAKLLKMYNVEYGHYPDSLDTSYCPATPEPDTRYCLKASGETTLIYTGGGQTFRVGVSKSGQDYYITEGSGPNKAETILYNNGVFNPIFGAPSFVRQYTGSGSYTFNSDHIYLNSVAIDGRDLAMYSGNKIDITGKTKIYIEWEGYFDYQYSWGYRSATVGLSYQNTDSTNNIFTKALEAYHGQWARKVEVIDISGVSAGTYYFKLWNPSGGTGGSNRWTKTYKIWLE